MVVDMKVYISDKQNIRQNYLDNIEYFRIHHLYNDVDTINFSHHYNKYPYAMTDPANFYLPYACRMHSMHHKGYKFINSPYPTKSQVDVTVDTIIYDKTGNMFVAFVCIEKKFAKVPQLTDIPHTYDARALIGYRDVTTSSLKAYPLTNFACVSFKKKWIALQLIKKDYMRNLKGSYLAGSVYGTNRFAKNVGDTDFFNESLFFKKYDSVHYYFQLYKELDEIKEYNYKFGN